MDPTLKTIGFLRNLTFDGLLSGEEVWLLAKFLNENEECRECWPGNVLFPMLHMAFDDGELSETEMSLLASGIAAVETQWLARKASPTDEKIFPENRPISELPPLGRPLLPAIDFTVEIPSSRGDAKYQVDLSRPSCTCADWQRRDHWPVGHPGRCCKHVASAFIEMETHLEPYIRAFLEDCAQRGTGTHPEDDWVMVMFPNRKPAVVSGGAGDWCNVYLTSGGAYERYGYNRREQRWAYGDAPPGARLITSAISEHFG